jgi:hypothetical protein
LSLQGLKPHSNSAAIAALKRDATQNQGSIEFFRSLFGDPMS